MKKQFAMPVEFAEFKSQCESKGYLNAVDQRLHKTPSNIFAMRTRNGIKCEIKSSRDRAIYVAGFGLNDEKLQTVQEELESQGFEIVRRSLFLCVSLHDDVLEGFWTLVQTIEDIDGLVQRKAGARRLIEAKLDEAFIAVAELIELALRRGRPEWLGRGNGTFDAIDSLITTGYSLKGREQERSGRAAYREHIVPCTFIERKAIEMFRAGVSAEQVADLIKANLFIIRISDEEADLLDNKLGLRTVMPTGWEFGNDPLGRLTHAGIILESKA